MVYVVDVGISGDAATRPRIQLDGRVSEPVKLSRENKDEGKRVSRDRCRLGAQVVSSQVS